KDEVKRLVRFVELNLLNPLPWRGHFDVVFCRNVMIYFDPETRRRVVKVLCEALRFEGYLLVGHTEALFGMDGVLRLVRPSVYQKK
ncbi:MAG: CheR family methyltransferase, partial [Thermofilaceae archaeon]